MTINSESKEVAVISVSRGDGRFDQASIILHRSTAPLIVVQFASVWAHEALHHQKLQQLMAKANEYGLYILLLAMPITGLVRVVVVALSLQKPVPGRNCPAPCAFDCDEIDPG